MRIRTKKAFNGNCIKYESKGHKDKNVSPKKYLHMIRPYLSDWRMENSIMSINFISSKDSDETRGMLTKSDDIKIMTGSETDYIIEEL